MLETKKLKLSIMDIKIINKEQFDTIEGIDYESLFKQFNIEQFVKIIITNAIFNYSNRIAIYFTADKRTYKALSIRNEKNMFSDWKIVSI